MKKFKRAGRNRGTSKDGKGDVLVKCLLSDKKGVVKGNMVTTIRVANARVSEIHSAIENFLF